MQENREHYVLTLFVSDINCYRNTLIQVSTFMCRISLKIPKLMCNHKPYIRISSDNTTTKRKKLTKRQTIICKTVRRKKGKNTNPTKNGGDLRCSGRAGCSCSTSGTRRVRRVQNPVISHIRW